MNLDERLNIPINNWKDRVQCKEDLTLRVEYIMDVYKRLLQYPSNYVKNNQSMNHNAGFFCRAGGACGSCFLKNHIIGSTSCLWGGSWSYLGVGAPISVPLRNLKIALTQYAGDDLSEPDMVADVEAFLESLS